MACAELMQAQSLRHTNKSGAIELLNSVVKRDLDNCDENEIKTREQAVMELGQLLFETKQAKELAGLIMFTRPFLNMISKAKAAKLVRGLVDMFLDMEAGTGSEVELCKECIMWAKDEKRTFLRQALEVRLISLYFDTKNYSGALQLASQILRELKKVDDKALLVEVHLLESKIYHALSNLPRARAALTSARTTANGIYCPPKLQAALDLQSGVLHAADERDFKTAFSYFYEAFEGYDSIDSPKAVTALKYMVLTKIMLGQAEEVSSIIGGKMALKYSGADITAMKTIAQASRNRSLAEFQAAKTEFRAQLLDDPIVKAHLDTLYDSLLENNLCRIIEPFSRVQMGHIAKIIKLGRSTVEKKLSQMILDQKFQGILDQAEGILIIFEDVKPDKTYENALNTINSMSKVVDALYSKTKRLT